MKMKKKTMMGKMPEMAKAMKRGSMELKGMTKKSTPKSRKGY